MCVCCVVGVCVGVGGGCLSVVVFPVKSLR